MSIYNNDNLNFITQHKRNLVFLSTWITKNLNEYKNESLDYFLLQYINFEHPVQFTSSVIYEASGCISRLGSSEQYELLCCGWV